MKRFALAVLFAVLLTPLARAQEARPVTKPRQYIYMLRVAPALHDQSTWTDKQKAATAQHFDRLKKATEAGQVIMAGRTTEDLDKTFGLVVFEADSPAAAQAYMEADPAVMAGVMTATVHPFSIALLRKP